MKRNLTLLTPKNVEIKNCFVKLTRINTSSISSKEMSPSSSITSNMRRKGKSGKKGGRGNNVGQFRSSFGVQQRKLSKPADAITPAVVRRVKTDKDLLKYTTPLVSERLSKRTPKPNRRYLQENIETKLNDRSAENSDIGIEEHDDYNSNMDDGSESDFIDEIHVAVAPITRRRLTICKTEPTKKVGLRQVTLFERGLTVNKGGTATATIAASTSGGASTKQSLVNALLNKRKLEFDSNGPTSEKKVLIRKMRSVSKHIFIQISKFHSSLVALKFIDLIKII